jgi:hypothetical protein
MRLSILFLLVVLVSCSKLATKESYETQFATYYKANMYNPDSFKLLGFTVGEGIVQHKANRDFIKGLFDKKIDKRIGDSLIQERLKHQEQVFFRVAAKNAVGVRVQNIVMGYFIDGELKYVEGKLIDDK